jgi:hypothetical protein
MIEVQSLVRKENWSFQPWSRVGRERPFRDILRGLDHLPV